jgi:hypothetical protein
MRAAGTFATVITVAAVSVLGPAVMWAGEVAGPAQGPTPASRDSIELGGRSIAAGATVRGPVVVAGGDLVVSGTIEGTAVAIAGDIVVREGGRITGDAIAAFGEVRLASSEAVVAGTARSLTGTFGASVRSLFDRPAAKETPRSPVSLVMGWFVFLLVTGLAVLVFANPYLEGVVDVLGQSFWKSLLTGMAGQLGLIPGIVLLVVVLALTVLGILLIPFAIVAAILGVAGMATLGFIAVVRLTGEAISLRSGQRPQVALGEKGAALRGVLIGVTLFMALWFVAAILNDVPVAGWLLRLLALMVTYVAATAGFGAALLSRGGTRRDAAVVAPAPGAEVGWQTPTPVAGVVAATRRTRVANGS